MLRRKSYIGRQLRPSQLARELLPEDQLWCTTCHMAVMKKNWMKHRASRGHTIASSKLLKMKRLSLDMWERHRGAPLQQESAHEGSIEAEFERFRTEQRERERMARFSPFQQSRASRGVAGGKRDRRGVVKMQRPKGINILITGTPGTGKTSLAELLAQELEDFTHMEVGKIVKESEFFSEYDEVLDTHIIEEGDEDRLLDFMEPLMVNGGNHLVDYHSSEMFPKRWFHLIVVLRASTEVLFERLTARNYSDAKRDENMEAEIQGLCEEEARGAYDEDIIIVRDNNTLDEMAATVDLIHMRVDSLKGI